MLTNLMNEQHLQSTQPLPRDLYVSTPLLNRPLDVRIVSKVGGSPIRLTRFADCGVPPARLMVTFADARYARQERSASKQGMTSHQDSLLAAGVHIHGRRWWGRDGERPWGGCVIEGC